MDGQTRDGQVVGVVDGLRLDGGAAADGFDSPEVVDNRRDKEKPGKQRARLDKAKAKVEARKARPDWSFGTGLKTAAVRWGTVVVLLIGPVAAVANWAAPQQVSGVSASDVATATQSASQDSQLAAGAATSLVWAWWTATADGSAGLEPLVAGGVDGDQIDQLPTKAPAPPRAVIVQATTHTTGTVWQVRLAVVDAAGDVGDYLVPVTVTAGHGIALTLPAQVPASQASGSDPVDTTDVDLNTPIAQTVVGFATALLTGGSSADVARWTSPGTTIAPVAGNPYESLQLQTLQLINSQSVPAASNGTTVDVTASFIATRTGSATSSDATRPEGATNAMAYTLRLAARDGRWEVQAITTPTVGRPAGR